MVLPCTHSESATEQIPPAVDLLRNLDTQHPDVLESHGLVPGDYHERLVFRSAIESIRGTYVASSLPQRHGLVAEVLEVMKSKRLIADYQPQGNRQRFDFQVMIRRRPNEMVALEVKGGEGNSINISERPLWASEFVLWCHLDGAIVNQPSHGAQAIIFNRVSREMVRYGKQVDAVIFKDARCNTSLRPCPKYLTKAPSQELGVAPDIFLMPQAIPSQDNPNPPIHTLETLLLPQRILAAHGVAPEDFDEHIWQVSIHLESDSKNRSVRVTEVSHKGKVVGSSRSAR